MHFIDILIISVYLIAMVLLGLKFSRENQTSDDYFLASRSLPFFPIALSVIATMVSAASFIGGPGGAYNEGIKYFMINANLPLVIFIASVVFVPFLYNLKVTSCYEYLRKRLGVKVQVLCGIGFLVTSIILTGTMIYGPSMILKALTGWDMAVIIPLLILIAIMYTLLGGIRAVIWSDAIQLVVLWMGIVLCIFTAIRTLDTPADQILPTLIASGKLQGLNAQFDLTLENGVWVSIFGIGLLHLQYFTCDQSQVQRLFTSKSMKTMKKSFLLSGTIVNIQFALFIFIGLLLFIKYDGAAFPDSNAVMIDFIINNIPVGIFGLILAAILAATMSSIDSLLNSMSAVFINDIYAPLKKVDASKVDLKASQKITIVFGILIMLFTYFGLNGNTSALLTMMGAYCSYITGSILGVFMLAMFTKTANEKGALCGFAAGIICTFLVARFTAVNWGWYNLVGVSACILVGYIVSRCTKERCSQEILDNFTFLGMRRKMIAEGRIKEDGVYIIPGSIDKSSFLLLGVFILQFVILGFLQYL